MHVIGLKEEKEIEGNHCGTGRETREEKAAPSLMITKKEVICDSF